MIEDDICRVYSGTSGLLLPVKNKLFYPEDFKEKSRLCYYGSLMNSIEINSSFYKVPMAATVKKWADDVPANFKFTFKLFKEITHNRDLAFSPEQINHFMTVIESSGDKKGCLLVQFPPSMQAKNFKQFVLLVGHLHRNDPDHKWNIAFEFRHPSWYDQDLYDLLAEYKMGLVIHDKSPANTPIIDAENPFIYLRFHGPDGNYRGTYPEDVLYEYAGYINDWIAESKTVFVYFNNTMGDAIANRNTLMEMIQKSK